ncbi:MAG: prepilin-type N-terminal cleavage/methylation domain-containing protein [Candidatus Vogelbacteria bacterium]|nr:prepilin-type N-terminal cleavage/methylation domain-containing protein [Candidatus Vogelbacteria bacterium]
MSSLKTKNCSLKTNQGFTLVELLVSIAVFIFMIVVVVNFQTDVFKLYGTTRDSIKVEQDERKFLREIVAEMRSIQSSDSGAYPIEIATSSEVAFFSDRNRDGKRERIRYFIDGTILKKGVTESSGIPAIYNSLNEQVVQLVHNVVSTSTPIFSYYPAGYEPTLTALESPVDIKLIRLIRIRISADADPRRAPAIFTNESEVVPRNLKDNL